MVETPLPHLFPGPINCGEGGKGFLHFLNFYFLNETGWAKGPQALSSVPHTLFAPFIHSFKKTFLEHLLCAQCYARPSSIGVWESLHHLTGASLTHPILHRCL